MANLSEEDDIDPIVCGADDADPTEDARQERLMMLEEHKAIAFLRKIGYEVKKITGYDR
jgi:hypothetical protein